ncbi:hypothetical protein [Streptomyces ginkgonis]|uniref:hypothetical protein n=1 Tax=Streptomyces ginkgonis TaxID=1812259 RepID=UPI002176B59B|nr:hypothetical protein [Streptomyces ginkgonis]
MNTPTTNDFLENARLLPTVTQADVAASRERIRRRVSDKLWRQALHDHAHSSPHGNPADRQDDHPPGAIRSAKALSEHAADDLRQICSMVLRDLTTARKLAGLVNNARIEPDGALAFACLLHLVGRSEAAQFWWQFTAGAGQPTAALCLFLLHLHRGDIRDATHWAAQATAMDDSRDRFYSATGPTHTLYCSGYTTVESMLLRTRAALVDKATDPDRCPGPALADAVQQLVVTPDIDFGDIPRADPRIADHLDAASA